VFAFFKTNKIKGSNKNKIFDVFGTEKGKKFEQYFYGNLY
jgi:hypothetical protein